jgi:hypothetical protein
VLVEHVALLEGAALGAFLAEPVQLFLREAGEDDLVIEVGKRFETDHTDFWHRLKATLPTT